MTLLPPYRLSALPPLKVHKLGVVPYAEALELQRALAEERIAGRIGDTLLLLEHPPVITLGRGARDTSLSIDPDALRRRGIEVFEIERGGDVTYHGPGQLVGYPILDLQRHKPDLHWYLRRLEETLIVALAGFGIHAERNPGYTGVWTAGRKIASIGIHVRQWVTWHGFALNVTTDLSPFSLIVPCGIPDVVMTSVEKEADRRISGQADAGQEADGRTGGRAEDADVSRHGRTGADLLRTVTDAVIGAFEQVFGFAASRSATPD